MVEKKRKTPNPTKWFDITGKTPGGFGFMFNRITGIGLAIYLFLHLAMLGKLISGEQAFNSFIALAHHPLIVAGEILVVIAVIYHGINGLRIAITSIGLLPKYQRIMLVIAISLTILIGTYFAIKMGGGA